MAMTTPIRMNELVSDVRHKMSFGHLSRAIPATYLANIVYEILHYHVDNRGEERPTCTPQDTPERIVALARYRLYGDYAFWERGYGMNAVRMVGLNVRCVLPRELR